MRLQERAYKIFRIGNIIKMHLSPEKLKLLETKGRVCMREKDFIEIVTSQEEWVGITELEKYLTMSAIDIYFFF